MTDAPAELKETQPENRPDVNAGELSPEVAAVLMEGYELVERAQRWFAHGPEIGAQMEQLLEAMVLLSEGTGERPSASEGPTEEELTAVRAEIERLQRLAESTVADSVAWVYYEVCGKSMTADEWHFYEPEKSLEYDRAELRREIAMGLAGKEAVDRAYMMALGRFADAGGLKHYRALLATGELTYTGLLNRLLKSDERKRNERAQRYQESLRTTPDSPTPVAAKPPTPQLFMAPLPRYMRQEARRIQLIDDMEVSGLTGLHLVVQTDWFDLQGALDFRGLGVRNRVSEEAFAIIEDLWHRLMQRNRDYHMHIWLWGDSDYHCNPIALQGPMGLMERVVYNEINRRFAGFENLTFGAGWDCFEWLTREHFAQMVDAIDLPITARGLTVEAYNDLADFPDLELKEHTTAQLEAYRAQYPDAPFLLTSDRCRIYHNGNTYSNGWSDDERNFTRERMQRVWEDCSRLEITGIFGELGPEMEDGGSMRFARPFREGGSA